jgi:signal transduction histidine kinase
MAPGNERGYGFESGPGPICMRRKAQRQLAKANNLLILAFRANPMKLIHIEDSVCDAELIKNVICDEWPDCKITRVASREEFTEQIGQGGFDLILSDYSMPGFDGLSALKLSRAMCPDKPFVFLSGTIGEERAIEALRLGAADYIIKDRPARLIPAVRRALVTNEEIKRREDAEEQVRQHTRQLAEAKERLAVLDKTKSDFLKLISHELRTPLNGLFGITEIVFDQSSGGEVDELRSLFEISRQRLLTIIEDALLLCQIEADGLRLAPQTVLVSKVLARAIEEAGGVAKTRNVSFGSVPDCPSFAIGEDKLLTKAMRAMVETAVRFAENGGLVSVLAVTMLTEIHLSIEAPGRSVPSHLIPSFFDVLAIAEPIIPGDDLGLGPPVAQRIIALFGGSVTVENLEAGGIRLGIRLRSTPRLAGE